MKKYIKPQMQITTFESENIMTESGLAEGKYNKNLLQESPTGLNAISL